MRPYFYLSSSTHFLKGRQCDIMCVCGGGQGIILSRETWVPSKMPPVIGYTTLANQSTSLNLYFLICRYGNIKNLNEE